jgi:acyl-CoA synthetase (AMP-forming)/AMP-acid ligase II
LQVVGATWFTAVPTIHQILLERVAAEYPGRQHARLRFVRSCSAPLHPATARALERLVDAPVLCAYGMTETTHQATSEPLPANGPRASGSAGVSTGVDIRIVADDGRDCSAGTAGEIWVAGQTVIRGYLDNPEETARSFTDGWYHTGDLGMLDREDYLTITGRIKNLINRGGEKISPEHVEGVLAGCPGVAEAAVFGAPDPKYGERIVALVVARPGQTVGRREVLAYCGTRLAAFEVPDDLKVVDALPHTRKGSFDRRATAASYAP